MRAPFIHVSTVLRGAHGSFSDAAGTNLRGNRSGGPYHFDSGEYAVEYLKRLSRSWRMYAGIEGSQDEISLIGELQWHVTPRVFVRFNSDVGLTSKATDWAPEAGIVFAFGPRVD